MMPPSPLLWSCREMSCIPTSGCLPSTWSWPGTERKLGTKIKFLCFKWISLPHFVPPAPLNSSARTRVAFPHALHLSSSFVGCLGTPAGGHGDVCLKILPGVGSFLIFPLLKVTQCFITNFDGVTKPDFIFRQVQWRTILRCCSRMSHLNFWSLLTI